MKKCPACNRTYDDSQSFCLMDGTALSIEDETQTIINKPPARRKSKFLPVFLVLLVFVFLAGIGIAGWLLFNKYSRQNQTVQNNQKTVNTKISPASAATPTPKATSASPTAESSPKAESSKDVSNSANTDEVTPIEWDTTPSGFKGEIGQTFKFNCPKEGITHAIYGSDIYTLDSSICTAAVHAGIITVADGGEVTVEIRPGRQIYGSTTRNDIKSNTWGPYDQSFVVR